MSERNVMCPDTNTLSDSKRKLLEQRLRGKKGGSRPAQISVIPRRTPDSPRRASPGQEWIFLAQQADPDSPSFTITSSFRLSADPDLALLEECVNRVLKRHEILRSNYRLDGEVVTEILHEDRSARIETERCESEDDLLDRAEALSRRPFDIGADPLFRLHYLQLPEGGGLLLLVIHHIVFDRSSLGVFWRETAAFYREATSGAPSEVAEIPVQYSDFAEWQRGRLAGGELDRQLGYWKAQLDTLPAPIPLPSDRPYPSRITDAGRLEHWRLNPEVTRKLKRFAAAENASPFMVLLLGLKILLQRYSGTSDVVVGSPVANRRHRETTDLIGFFLNTVALRSKLEEDATVRETLARVRETVLGALENQDVPFDRVVDAVKPPRVPGRHPLVQVMFVYQRENEATPELRLGDIDLRHVYVETRTSKFDLTLFAAESGEGMETILEYRTDLFEPETMHRVLCHFAQVVESMADNPDGKLSELQMLTPEEQGQLLSEWQGEPLPIDGSPGVIEQIRTRASDAPAIVGGGGECVTARQLETCAENIARSLRSLGIGPGDRVAHFMGRSAEAIAGLLGIMKSGAAYVPIDPEYPANRRRFIIDDAAIKAAVTTSALRGEIASFVEEIVVVDSFDQPVRKDGELPLPPNEARQPAYLIYTSGSTGEPKGVVVTHRNLLSSTQARARYYAAPPKRFLLIPSLSFDSSVAGIFWTLSQGGALVLAGADDHRDPARLRELIRKHEVTDLLCIPTLYREILAPGSGDLLSLKRVIVAGEACPPDLVTGHHELLPSVALFNEYGPTEATVWATVHRCEAGEAVPIGRPITNTTAFVLDDRRRAVPAGAPGELYLGGEGLALGYYDREELTKERFVECRLPIVGTVRLYRTGDRARWNSDGVLEFLGRVDDQLKVRGYRIEPGEIETELERHPGVTRAVVLATEISPGAKLRPKPLADLVRRTPESQVEELLDEIEKLSPEEVVSALGNREPDVRERIVAGEKFRLELHRTSPGFIVPPREAQRNWLLSQAMNEFADDLAHLDRVARTFVPGTDYKPESDLRDVSHAELSAAEIMEDWQTPLMKAMADHVAGSRGDVLEVGFGRGVSAEFIQRLGVRSHTVVECNDHSVNHYFKPWRQSRPRNDIRLLHGRWQDVDDQLGLYDGIFFHAFPMNEEEFTEYILKSVTFAEHAFPSMAAHLKDGGVFTYLTTEIDSLSRRHQRLLFRHFRSITLHVEKLNVPTDTRDIWWADSMVVIKAVK